MQIPGLFLLAFVVWYGFGERSTTTISAFDLHAFVMVIGGCLAAVFVSSSTQTAWRTLRCLGEIVPGFGILGPTTRMIEATRVEVSELWLGGRRAQAVEKAENSGIPAIQGMMRLVLQRAPEEATRMAFTELQHAALGRWQPAVANWELLAKLAPSFGMVGTITGMICLFRGMGDDGSNIGGALSLALLATLYGVAFGAGVAGPIGHYLRGLLDEQLGAIERCERTVGELVARADHSARVTAG